MHPDTRLVSQLQAIDCGRPYLDVLDIEDYLVRWKLSPIVNGLVVAQDEIVVNSKRVPAIMNRERLRIGFQISDDGKGLDVDLK